jgi:glycosyltransferase involved in cell wall biosynthesis
MPPPGMGRKAILPIASVADFIRGFRQHRFFRRQGRAVLHLHDAEWNLVELDAASGLDMGGRIVRALYSPLDGIPAVMTKHFLFPPGAPENLRRWERTLTLQFLTIVCVDRGIEEEVKRWADEEALERDVRFIPNGIDPDRFHPRPMPPFDRLRVGFVARLDAARGESFLLDFLSNLPDFVEFHGALATDAERFGKLHSRVRSDRVHLERNVPQERLPEFYAGIHVLINPLTADYPITRSALEAMACGRCVIMFGRHPRPPLVNQETALFLPIDLGEVVRQLRELYQNPEIVSEIGGRARRAVERDFSNARVLPQLASLYESLFTGIS